MSSDNSKVKSNGFGCYIPPGRRSVNADTEQLNVERGICHIKKTSEKRPDHLLNGKSPLSGLEVADDMTTAKATKKLCRGIPREYIPPSRRAQISDVDDGQVEMNLLIAEMKPSTFLGEEISMPRNIGTEATSTTSEKAVKAAKKTCTEFARENYVPPARRALIAEEMRLAAQAEALGIIKPPKVISKKCDGFVLAPVVLPFLEENNIQDEYSVRRCSFILRGLPPELPDYSKDRYTKPFCDRGAVVRWLSPVEAILVFPTETIAKAALSLKKNSLIQLIALQDLIESEANLFLGVSTEIYNSIKPERDCRVANRMISAALGISLPKRAPAVSKCTATVDAWDD
jgi:hypothetical protein